MGVTFADRPVPGAGKLRMDFQILRLNLNRGEAFHTPAKVVLSAPA